MRRKMIPFLLLLCGAMIDAGSATAQHSAESRDHALLVEARRAEAAGDTKAARSAYKKMVKTAGLRKQGLIGLGELAAREQNWKVVEDVFSKLEKEEPDNRLAWYYLAVSKRENGIFRPILVRKLVWRKSRKYFKALIAKNERFRDVLFQYALLLRYEKKYEQAVDAALRQVRLTPENITANLGLFRIYKYLIRHRDADQALAWLLGRGGAYDHFFAGELLRRMGKYDQALEQFAAVRAVDSTFSPVALSLAEARLHYQQQNPEKGQQLFYRALETIRNELDCGLVFNKVKFILTDAELDQYHATPSPEKCAEFFATLWKKRDPLPAEPLNPRLTEHFRRVRYAEEHYVFDGFKAWINNPDKSQYLKFPRSYSLNDEFNDKGLIYIRHGEPDDRIVSVGEFVPRNESWLYYPRRKDHKPLTFHFVIDEKMGKANNWRLTPVLYDAKMLEDRLQWGNIYHKLLTATPVERLSYEVEMADDSKKDVLEGLSTDRHTWPSGITPFSFPIRIATFRGRDGLHQVSVAYALPVNDLRKTLENGFIVVDMGAVLQDSLWREVARSTHQLRQRPPQGNPTRLNYLINGFELTAGPGTYHAAFHARPRKGNMLAGYQFELTVPDYDEPGLQISDILLASVIEEAGTSTGKFIRKGLRVIPNPTASYPRTLPVYVYLEIYHLQTDGENRGRYRIEYSMDLKKRKSSGVGKLFAFWKRSSKNVVSVASERESTGADPVEFIALDVHKAVAGEYELHVRITDQATGKQVTKTVALELR